MDDKYGILTPRDQETLAAAKMGTRMGYGGGKHGGPCH